MDLRSVPIEFHTALEEAGIGPARIGGLALAAHGAARAAPFDGFGQRARFGEPEVDRAPWRGDDFRLC